MDDSWDEGFSGSGDLNVPNELRSSSRTVSQEGAAVRELSETVSKLRTLLIESPADPSSSAAIKAAGLVHASIEDPQDAFYASESWERLKDANFHIHGDSFAEMLAQARKSLEALTAGL